MNLRRLALVLAIASCALASDAHAQVLYWLDTSFGAPTLNKADASGAAIASVALPAATLPEGLVSDVTGRVYWAESAWTGARVERSAPNLASITPLVTGASCLRGIAVDDVDHRLYWTTSNQLTGATIQRSALDGSGLTTLVTLAAGANPRGIAVDHAGGRIYWADFDLDGIYRANLDGSGAALWIGLPSQAHPWGVAFDPVGQQVYWTEYAGKLRRAPTATGLSSTLLGGLANPTYIALDPAGGFMYWSEGGAGVQHIYKATLAGAGKTALTLPLTTYGGLAFQPNASVDTPEPALPLEFALSPLSPNPSRGPVQIGYALPREARVRLTVIDLQGREVAVLADGTMPAGRHAAAWNDTPGRAAPAGVYFVRLAADGRSWTRRLVRTR